MRPRQVIVVTGTGTNVAKTWVAQALIATLIEAGVRTAARKRGEPLPCTPWIDDEPEPVRDVGHWRRHHDT